MYRTMIAALAAVPAWPLTLAAGHPPAQSDTRAATPVVASSRSDI